MEVGVDDVFAEVWKDSCFFSFFLFFFFVVVVVLRGTIVYRTYRARKHLYISLFLLTVFGLIYYAPPVIVGDWRLVVDVDD